MDFVTSAVKETGINEHHPLMRRCNACLKIYACAAFFIHDAHFDGVAGKGQNILHMFKHFIGKGHFLRSMHLWLNDIDGLGLRVSRGTLILSQVMNGDQAGDQCIKQTLMQLASICAQHCRCGHQMTNIAHQHEASAPKDNIMTRGGKIFAILVQSTCLGFAGFFEC